MKKLLLILFSALLIALIVSASFYLKLNNTIPKSKNPLKETMDFLNMDTTNYDVVFIGSSRIFLNVDPRLIDSLCKVNSRSIALLGARMPQKLMLLKKYLQHHPSPKVFVLGVDYITLLGSQLPNGYPDYYEYMDDSIVNETLSASHWRFRHKNLFQKYDLFAKHTTKTDYQKYAVLAKILHLPGTLDNLGDKPPPLDTVPFYKGYRGLNQSWTEAGDREMREKEHLNFDESGISFFEEFIRIAQASSADLVFIFPPVYKKYDQRFPNVKDYYAELDRLTIKHQIPLWNYRVDTLCNYKKYFMDGLHMNKPAAEIFSATLARDLKAYLDKKNQAKP